MIAIDINTMTLDELEAFGDAMGVDPTQIASGAWKPSSWKDQLKVTRVYLWMVQRREDQSVTLEDIGKLTVAEITGLVDALPSEAGGGNTSRASRSTSTSSGSRRRNSGV